MPGSPATELDGSDVGVGVYDAWRLDFAFEAGGDWLFEDSLLFECPPLNPFPLPLPLPFDNPFAVGVVDGGAAAGEVGAGVGDGPADGSLGAPPAEWWPLPLPGEWGRAGTLVDSDRFEAANPARLPDGTDVAVGRDPDRFKL